MEPCRLGTAFGCVKINVDCRINLERTIFYCQFKYWWWECCAKQNVRFFRLFYFVDSGGNFWKFYGFWSSVIEPFNVS